MFWSSYLYSNINSQLDATITNFIDNCIQLNMFRALISPILTRTRLWYNVPAVPPAGTPSVLYTIGALYHKLQTQSSAPEVGRIYLPKHVELIEIINRICYCCIQLAAYIIVSVTHGHTNINTIFPCLLCTRLDTRKDRWVQNAVNSHLWELTVAVSFSNTQHVPKFRRIASPVYCCTVSWSLWPSITPFFIHCAVGWTSRSDTKWSSNSQCVWLFPYCRHCEQQLLYLIDVAIQQATALVSSCKFT